MGLALAIWLTALAPHLKLTFFAPFLIIQFYRSPLYVCLWQAFLCGFIIDLLSTDTPLGAYAFAYTLTSAILFTAKQQFFEDQLMTYPALTALFGSLSSALLMLTLTATGQGLIIGWQTLLTDLIGMPLLDGIYAALCFTLPFRWLGKKAPIARPLTPKRPR